MHLILIYKDYKLHFIFYKSAFYQKHFHTFASNLKIKKVMNAEMYKGYIIEPNNTGYVNFDFYNPDDELISGDGETIDDCKEQIDELVNIKL